MTAACPRLVIAGTDSGVGKTSLARGAGALPCAAGTASADVQGRARLPRSDLSGDGLRPDLLQPRRLDDFARVRLPALRPGDRRRRHRAGRRRDGHVRRGVAHDARRKHGRDRPVARRAGAVGRRCPRGRPQPGGDRQGFCRVRAGRARGGSDRQPRRLAAPPRVAGRVVDRGRDARRWSA